MTPLYLKIRVSWTVDVKNYVESGRWYLVPLLGLDYDSRLTVAQKDVYNKADISALAAERYQDNIRDVQAYEEDRANWSEKNSGWRPPESDESDQGPDWVPEPAVPAFYDSGESYFDV